MNKIRESMEGIRASEELKKNTLDYLKKQQNRSPKSRIWRYALTAACLLIFLTAGSMVYTRPVSYISIDVNPSIELAINRFGRVVAADAYNADAEGILEHVRLKNLPYIKAIERLLGDESYSGFLTEDSQLFFTVISENSKALIEKINVGDIFGGYGVQIYTSDMSCRKEAHQNHMSFGKYRAYQELSGYDASVTVEECHEMSMGEIADRIETCKECGEGGAGECFPDEEQHERRKQNHKRHHGH